MLEETQGSGYRESEEQNTRKASRESQHQQGSGKGKKKDLESHIKGRDRKRANKQPYLCFPIFPSVGPAFDKALFEQGPSLLRLPCRQKSLRFRLLFGLHGLPLPFHAFLVALPAAMQDADHQRRRRPAGELELLPYDHLLPERYRKDHPEQTDPETPDDQLPEADLEWTALSLPAVSCRTIVTLSEERLQGGDDSHEAATQRHRPHGSGHGLYEDVLNWVEREGEVPGQDLEDGEADEGRGHGHGADPPGLEAEVGVGEGDQAADDQADEERARREALGRGDRGSLGRHGGIVIMEEIGIVAGISSSSRGRRGRRPAADVVLGVTRHGDGLVVHRP